MSSDEEICLICEHPTRSLHFQVNCCRACASFFRRSIKAKLVYHCQRGTGRCDLTSRGKSKPICRYCRLKKCINMGMRIDADTEVNLASNSTSRAPVNQAVTIMPLSVDGPNFKYNPTPLLTLVKENLTKDTRSFTKRSIGFELSPLQQMCQQLTLFLNQKAINPSSIIISPDINVTDNIRFHEDFLQRLARVVTGTEDFVKIDNHQKFNVFRHFWATFLCLERAYQSITIFGQETTDMRFMITNTQGIDLGPIYGIPQDSEVCKLYQPLVDRFFAHLINPMRELKLTMFEFSFLASQLLWSLIDVNGLTPKTHEIAKEVLERNSSDMHSYYTYDLNQPNYAPRLLAIAGLVPVIESIMRSRKDLLIIGKFVNIRKMDFLDCELME